MSVVAGRAGRRPGCRATALVLGLAAAASGQWVTRDARWQLRGEWNWSLSRELPELYREFNGIDFGHAHLAETLLRSTAPEDVERARRSSTSSPPRRPCRPTRARVLRRGPGNGMRCHGPPEPAARLFLTCGRPHGARRRRRALLG